MRRTLGGSLFGVEVNNNTERLACFRTSHLGYDERKRSYPKRCPILYPPNTAMSINTMFRRKELIQVHSFQPRLICSHVFKIAQGLLFGPQSIHGSPPSPMTLSNVNATIWRVDSTTPGLVALCAVLVCYIGTVPSAVLNHATGPLHGFC